MIYVSGLPFEPCTIALFRYLLLLIIITEETVIIIVIIVMNIFFHSTDAQIHWKLEIIDTSKRANPNTDGLFIRALHKFPSLGLLFLMFALVRFIFFFYSFCVLLNSTWLRETTAWAICLCIFYYKQFNYIYFSESIFFLCVFFFSLSLCMFHSSRCVRGAYDTVRVYNNNNNKNNIQ